jgi:sugar fermentation stimulation protein A
VDRRIVTRDGFSLPFEPLIPAAYVRRDNRFLTYVRLDGHLVAAHLPNPGRLRELLIPGRRVLLRPAPSGRDRRTDYDLLLLEHEGGWVSLDSRLPNQVVAGMLEARWLSGFEGYESVRREVRLGESVIDFCLEGPRGRCWVEVKSVTLVEDGVAAFPDAVTLRGQRHVRELARAVEEGERAVVLFLVQREDARRFAPHDATDPDFGAALRSAAALGVEVRAVRCRVTPEDLRPLDELPVHLG